MKRTLRNSEQGMVSIIVTMIIMAVLSLIVVGFAQLARREQREALDKQLSTQAFYAAESGINDALRKIKDNTLTTVKKTTCDPGDFVATKDLDISTGVSYTCLLVDRTPSTLEYGAIELDKSTVIPLNPYDTSTSTEVTPGTIEISWNRSDGGGSGYYYNAADTVAFPPVASWGDSEAGVLRIDLIPADGGLSRDTLADRMFTTFLYPGDKATDPSTISYVGNAGGVGGTISRIKCDTNPPRKCKAEVSFKNPSGNLVLNDKHFFLRITSIYSKSTVTVTAHDSLNHQLSFKDGQYVIDSTGKAGDVLKRVRVHKSAGDTDYRYPNYALNSVQDICKRLEVYPARPAQAGQPAEPGSAVDGC